jgi:hypothetical protein
MTDASREELTSARNALDEGARVLLWAVLFSVWTIWAWPALLVAVITACLAYQWMIRSGTVYATLLESAFDIHRNDLYRSLRWPLPKNAEEEFKMAVKVTQYLALGPREAQLMKEPAFTDSAGRSSR